MTTFVSSKTPCRSRGSTWTWTPTLPGDRLFCGGSRCLFALEFLDDEVGSVFKFCPASRSWAPIVSSIPTLLFGRLNPVWAPSWVYHGGYLYGTVNKCVQSLNVSTGQWASLPPLSTERARAAACVVGGRLFVVGGGTASVEEYAAPEHRWVSVPDMPRAVENAAAVDFDGKLLVIGGWNNDLRELSAAVVEYDLGDGSWKELPSLLTARQRCTVTVLGGDPVVMGGIGPTTYNGQLDQLRSVERYNRRRRCWEVMPSLNGTLADAGALVMWV